MSSADLCQMNGFGLSFQVSAQLQIAARSLTVRWAERCSFLVVSAENHRGGGAWKRSPLLLEVKRRTIGPS
jgi:hypothetical protein